MLKEDHPDMVSGNQMLSDLLRKYRIALVMDDEGAVHNVLTRIDLIDHVARMTS